MTGTNRVTTESNAKITISNSLSSHYLNEITTGSGDDVISIHSGVHTVYGQNKIETGDGNDKIDLHGTIDTGSLSLTAGEGYDTFVLHAGSHSQFRSYYQSWSTDFYSQGGIASSGLEAIQVNSDSDYRPDHID